MTSTPEASVPDGFLKNHVGNLVAIGNIKPIDVIRDSLVKEIIDRALALNVLISSFKNSAFDDIAAFVELSGEQYGARVGGQKGNVSLLSFDGQFKIQRAIAEHITFDERLLAAKVLIDECITVWSEGSRPELQVLVNDAFRVDQAGKINTGRVLGLRRLEITDPRWMAAMKSISEAVQVVGSKSYIRIYKRDDRGEYQPISLDVASA